MSVLVLHTVTKAFNGIQAVDRASLGFDPGKITALIGPNGAGKTTIFNLISGFLMPDEGTILYREKNISGLPPWEIAHMGIGRLFQDVRLFNHMAAKDNVLTAFKNQKGENALRSVFSRRKVNREEAVLTDQTLKLLKFVGLSEKTDELAENLSYGQQKLLSIARLLAADSEVFLLDEPTAGVSPLMLEHLLDIIRNLARGGKTIVVTEHNMNVILAIADWVYFMDEGQVTSFGLPNEVLGDPEVRAAYIGL